jgi:hypothetical protein
MKVDVTGAASMTDATNRAIGVVTSPLGSGKKNNAVITFGGWAGSPK